MTTLSYRQQAIIRTLIYFDIFKFPLFKEEIFKYCTEKLTENELESDLQDLLQKGIIHTSQPFFFLDGSSIESIPQRIKNQKIASNAFSKVKRYTKIISFFPFVRGVYISGSYSKGVLSADGDVDYFIICTPGRLWLCRSLLIAFKKIVLLNSRKYFCLNYFIDTEQLAIIDKNIFSATEIATLLPGFNIELFQQFLQENKWVYTQFPNLREERKSALIEPKNWFLKRVLERLFSARFGEKLDTFLLALTLNTWKKRFPHLNADEFDLNMRSRKGVSKHHPQGFQSKVLAEVERRFNEITKQTKIDVEA